MDNGNRMTCLVVGAGLAGLIAARELQRRGVSVVQVTPSAVRASKARRSPVWRRRNR